MSLKLNGGATERSFFVAWNASQHTPTNTVWGKVALGSISSNHGGHYDGITNYRWTPPPGPILVIVNVEMNNADSNGFYIAIYKNGSNFVQMARRVNNANNQGHLCAIPDVANGTDYYELYVYRNSGNGNIGAWGARFQGVSL